MADYDILSDAFYDDPYPTLAAMRRDDPCWYDPRLGAYVLTRFNDIERTLQDPRFSAERVRQFTRGAPPHLQPKLDVYVAELERWLLFCDPPIHTRLRTRLMNAFGPRFIPLIREAAAEATRAAVAAIALEPSPDLIAHFSYPIPTRVLTRLLGIEEADIERFKQWTTDIFALIGAGVANEAAVDLGYRGVTELREYVLELIARKRAEPQEDVLSALCSVELGPGEEPLSDDDVIGLFMAIIVAGHETSTNLIGNALHGVMTDVRVRDWIVDNGGVTERSVDEFVRFDGPVWSMIRRAKQDLSIAGQLIREGDFVFSMLNSGNRDPRRFPTPDRLDLDRPWPEHVGLGVGIHRCVGAGMARVVVREAVSQFVAAFPHAAIGGPLEWQRNMSIRGLNTFPVALDARARAGETELLTE
jgi:pimeloyl-[acyl-carrier protein] synthase